MCSESGSLKSKGGAKWKNKAKALQAQLTTMKRAWAKEKKETAAKKNKAAKKKTRHCTAGDTACEARVDTWE